MGARNFLRRLRDDESGAYVVEFALVTPIFLILTVGALDLGHTVYTKAVLEGALQKAARDSALEGAAAVTEADGTITTVRQGQIDELLRSTVKQIQPFATVNITRRSFKDFSTIKTTRETFVDANSNSRCDSGEKYFDSNRSGVWDVDNGDESQGGAKDVTVYTTTATYQRLFPTLSLLGMDRNVTMTARTVLANQPYSDQLKVPERTCP